MLENGIPVYLVQEDMEERGLSDKELIAGIKKVALRDLPALIDQYDHVWHW